MNTCNWKERTELLTGSKALDKLGESHVLVAGLGGVGGYAAELLCRAGVGKLTLIDDDRVHATNRNRQIIAMKSTEEKYKTELMCSRLKDINPDIDLVIKTMFITEENAKDVTGCGEHYIVDAIDTLTPKVSLLESAVKNHIPVVSSMGSGGRTDPTQITISDIEKSHHCKFAYIVRKYLHRRGIYSGIQVIFSPEPVPESAIRVTDGSNHKKSVTGTISYMPALFGCYCASVVIRDLFSK